MLVRRLKLLARTFGIRGLLLAIAALVTKRVTYLTVRDRNCKHPLRLRILWSDPWVYKQVFVEKEYDFLAATPPNVIVDAGANIGLASVYFAHKYPNAKIIAIEPERGNFELLQANTAAYPGVIALQAALWGTNAELDLIDPGLGTWGYTTDERDHAGGLPGTTRHTVPAITVDKLMQDFGLSKIDILKIDIEGAEREVFADTSAWIDKVDAIIVELHERMKPGCNRSFYCGSLGFDNEWQRGENIYLSRANSLLSPPHGSGGRRLA